MQDLHVPVELTFLIHLKKLPLNFKIGIGIVQSNPEEECFDLMLFGGTKALINDKRRCTKDIQFGTPLFLLNIQSDILVEERYTVPS